MSNRLRSRLAEEHGFALVATLVTMVIAGILAATAVNVAIGTDQQARSGVQRKDALEAAEAGLQVALYRTNMTLPAPGSCFGDSVQAPAADGTCASSVYTLGNGASYRYFTTPVLSPGATCVGSTVYASTGVSNICITSVGTSDGVTARSQIRAAAFSAVPLFPYAGITGLGGISNLNNTTVKGPEASNEQISASNGTVLTGPLELGPQGSYSPSGNAPSVSQVHLPGPLVLSPVSTGNSATVNDDYRITNYTSNPSSPTAPYDQSSKVTFDPTTRALSMANNASLTLGGSVYNFCSLTTKNNATINLAPGVSTEIIIDSPQDTGSGCPAGSGSLNTWNNVTWVNPSDSPTNLQIYVYGPDTGGSAVKFFNNGAFYGVLYAPTSDVELGNNGTFTGAISAQTVTLDENFQFVSSPQAGTLNASTQGLYYRTAWTQCSATWSPSAPTAGCG